MPDEGTATNGAVRPDGIGVPSSVAELATSSGPNNDGAQARPTARARLQRELTDFRAKLSQPSIRDITHAFISATNKLKSGQLVKDEHFTLFEAVGALEIMDAKMDSGFVPPGDDFAWDFDVAAGLPAAEVLWIMDELFRLETAFHQGHPLSQNLYTSLHIFRLISPTNTYPYDFDLPLAPSRRSDTPATQSEQDMLVHCILRAYCIGTIKCASLVLRMVQSQLSFEEEDFATYLFGRELLPRMEIKEAMTIVVDAIDRLDMSDVDVEFRDAFRNRLLVRQEALFAFENGGMEEWQALRSLIIQMADIKPSTTSIPVAFSVKIQRQLATSTPPRPLLDLSWENSCEKWLQLCDDVIATLNLTSDPTRFSPHCLRKAVWAFAYRTPTPSAFTRAKMQELLTRDDKVADDVLMFDLFLADIRDLVLAGDPLGDLVSFQISDESDIRYQASRIIEGWMSKAFGEYLNLYRVVCLNRCRTRRQLTQLLPVFAELEVEANSVDVELNQIIAPRQILDQSGQVHQLEPLTLWTSINRDQITQYVVHLGFETDIYLLDELATVYMILAETLNSYLASIQRSEDFMIARLRTLQRGRSYEYANECETALIFLESLKTRSEADFTLASCLADIYLLLETVGIIDVPVHDFTSASLRYEARMKPLLRADPGRWPSLDQINAAKSSKNITVRKICEQTPHLLRQARTLFAKLKTYSPLQARFAGTETRWAKEIKQMEMLCIAISVSVSQLENICKRHDILDSANLRGKVELVPDGKRYHDWWTVPQLREKT